MPRKIFVLIVSCFILLITRGQNDSSQQVNYKQRKIVIGASGTLLAAGSLVYLNQAWYSDYSTGKFHFFNDNTEWLQMDKAGHFVTNYQTSRLSMAAFKWAGFSKKQQLWIGGTIGLGYMTVIEVMDGYSRGWGFSWGDEIVNILGSAAAISQHALWEEQRIQFKFSYAQSGLAKYNPSLLGETPYTQVIKDYNGQTIWLSVNPSSFMKKNKKFPRWLSLAVGYGAYGMLGAESNNFVVQDAGGNVLKFERARRFYLSLDVDLTRIRTKSKLLKSIFSVVNILKFPAPALQYSGKQFRFYYLYY
ncbi:MAG: DUF2279 domain-containing protein [Bacteroidota bacterium]